MISDGLENNLPEDQILSKLQTYLGLTKEQAMQYYSQFTKNN